MTGITDKLTNGIAALPDYIEPWVRELLTDARTSILTLQADTRTKAATIEALDEQVEELASITEFIEARTDAPRVDDHGNQLSIVQRLGAMQAEIVRVRAERDEAADEAKAADLHRNLNRRVAEALGLLKMQTDPETGEEFLPSWHDMPEKVESLRAEVKRLQDGFDAHAAETFEKVAAIHSERDELRLTLAAEQGRPEGAPSSRWKHHLAGDDGWGVERWECREGDEVIEIVRRLFDGTWEWWNRLGTRIMPSARAAMIAADKAIGQPVQATDLRPSNVLLTLTPALQARVEALGYVPGETPAGLLPWLVDFAEEAQREVASMQNFMKMLDNPRPIADKSDPDVTHFRSALINYVVICFARQLIAMTPERAPNCISVIATPSSEEHDLVGYRMEIAVARPGKLLPHEQRDETKAELTEARDKISRWESEATYLLDHTPGAIRVREGGGPENLRASLSVTWMKLCRDTARLAEVMKPVKEVDVEKLRKRYGEGVVPPCRVCGAELTPAESDWRRTIYACPGGDWSTGKWAPFVAGRTLADAHFSASRVEIPNGDPDVIALLSALQLERAKPRPWLITETDGSACVAATSKETAWAAYEAAIGGAIEFDGTEYHVHEVTVKDVDGMLEAALAMDEEIHKVKQAARIAGMDAEEKGKVLDEIRNALGNGADEALWPPGKTLGGAVEGLVERLANLIHVADRVVRWLDTLTEQAERHAATSQFESLRIACHADAKNYRATGAEIRKAMGAGKGSS